MVHDSEADAIRSAKMVIDPNLTVKSLLVDWKNGKKTQVIETLAQEHPAMTALLIVQGSHDRELLVEDCNEITNLLIERRQKICK
jgi:hypothetical protein